MASSICFLTGAMAVSMSDCHCVLSLVSISEREFVRLAIVSFIEVTSETTFEYSSRVTKVADAQSFVEEICSVTKVLSSVTLDSISLLLVSRVVTVSLSRVSFSVISVRSEVSCETTSALAS